MNIEKILESLENDECILCCDPKMNEFFLDQENEVRCKNGIREVTIYGRTDKIWFPEELIMKATVMKKVEAAMWIMRRESQEEAPIVIDETDIL